MDNEKDDVIDFLMRTEHLSFVEAIRVLAKERGYGPEPGEPDELGPA